MNSWEELKYVVGQWASANFGSQNGLGCIAPLLGLCEEVGELDSAVTNEDIEDAKGDITIFLMDYCYRAGVCLSHVPTILPMNNRSIAEAVGRLHHVQLKRLQRIRGMEDDNTFRAARDAAVLDVLVSLVSVQQQPFRVGVKVWDTVVSKRKWHTMIGKPLTAESCREDYQRVVKELNNLE